MSNRDVICIGGVDYEIEIDKCALPDSLDIKGDIWLLNKHMCELSGDIYYHGYLHSLAKTAVERAVWDLERTHAEIDRKIRHEAESVKKKMTEKAIENAIKEDHDYQTIKEELIDAKDVERQLSSMMDAFKAKKDAMITVGANMRAEMTSMVSINENKE